MRLLDFYPSKGSFSPGEMVTFLVELEAAFPQEIMVRVFIQHLDELLVVIEESFQLAMGEQTIQMEWTPSSSKPAGYSARLEIFASDSDTLIATTAFEVLSSWTNFPRYGFLTDFSASRADPDAVLKKLTRFHINGLQFYDWQYRHDQLLAPSEDYVDPLGRTMSLASVRALVDAAHRHGMAAMPYLAIYAASAEFWRAHPDWALYDEGGNPIPFGENFLGLMNPSSGSLWSEHLLAEGAHTLQEIPFDGLHIDQYGEPKQAWEVHHQPVDLPRAFVDFIRSASNQHPDKTILFNAVGNWPIEALAESAADFMYIEIWPPDVEYYHVAEIVLNAVRRSRGKAVVIALYLPASHPANNLLADALILACGGTRIELGEDARLLTDPYFPKHEELPLGLDSELRKLYDFAVRNGEWLRPYTLSEVAKETWAEGKLNPSFISTDDSGSPVSNGQVSPAVRFAKQIVLAGGTICHEMLTHFKNRTAAIFESHDSIWTVARRYPESLVLQLVNLSGLNPHQHWDEEHALPTPCENLFVNIEIHQRPSQIFWDAPENSTGPQPLNFEYMGGILTFQIPHIYLTGLVVIYE